MQQSSVPTAFDSGRSAFVFIEFQAEWLAEDGMLFQRLVEDKAAFRRAVDQAARLLAAARKHACHIAHAGLDLRDDPSYLLFGAGQEVLGLRGAIQRAGTWTGAGAAFVSPFVPQAGEFIVHGRSGASALKNSTLDAFLRNNRIDTLYLAGFATHVCVESTLRDAHDSGLDVYVVKDACAAFSSEQDAYFHRHILHHFGAATDVETLLQRFGAD